MLHLFHFGLQNIETTAHKYITKIYTAWVNFVSYGLIYQLLAWLKCREWFSLRSKSIIIQAEKYTYAPNHMAHYVTRRWWMFNVTDASNTPADSRGTVNSNL